MPLFFTPNPCLERTYFAPDFAAGASFRAAPDAVRVTAGGKGINAARVAQNFGAPAQVLAPVGARQKAQLRALLQEDGLQAELIEIAADTRTTINIVHRGHNSEIIEAGWPLRASEGATLAARFEALLENCEMAVIGGAYPPAAPELEKYWGEHGALLCALAARAGKRLFYDGHGAAFERALQSPTPPWAIKPNLSEARGLLNRALETPAEECLAVRDLRARGVEVVLLSCGARGLWVGWKNQLEWISAPAVETVSAVGSGDALVGAFVAKWLQNGDVWEAAKWGVAAGAANAAQLEAARVGPDDAATLMNDF